MNFMKLVNDYTECNKFEIQLDSCKVKIFYYDSVKNFSPNKIIILNKNKDYIIKGKNLVIDTMFTEYLIITGEIFSVEIGKTND